ncbi:MAG: hypothetical protein M3443_08025 [Actinomycetota bacterium]|nr:hypothetical protein [Actinomycetota bacterium]
MTTVDLSAFGITGTLVLVIAYLLASNHRDRGGYGRALALRDTQHAGVLTAARAAHAEDLTGMRARLSALETRLGELELELDGERDRRRAAEDAAAWARRRA